MFHEFIVVNGRKKHDFKKEKENQRTRKREQEIKRNHHRARENNLLSKSENDISTYEWKQLEWLLQVLSYGFC